MKLQVLVPPDPKKFSLKDAMKEAVSKDHSLQAGEVWCTTCRRRLKVDSVACLLGGWPKCCGSTMSLTPPISKAEKAVDAAFDRTQEDNDAAK